MRCPVPWGLQVKVIHRARNAMSVSYLTRNSSSGGDGWVGIAWKNIEISLLCTATQLASRGDTVMRALYDFTPQGPGEIQLEIGQV